MKLFEFLVNDYRKSAEELMSKERVSGDRISSARAAYDALVERARDADAAVQVLDALLPKGVCARCGTPARCVPVDSRDDEAHTSRDVALCPHCVRKERVRMQEQIADSRAQEKRFREQISCLEKMLKKSEVPVRRVGLVNPGRE
jgi:hypothetical protein